MYLNVSFPGEAESSIVLILKEYSQLNAQLQLGVHTTMLHLVATSCTDVMQIVEQTHSFF